MDEIIDNVAVYGLPIETLRLRRMWYSAKLVYKKAIEINADIYHFHDPELMPCALKLKKLGKKVIMDVHEDLPAQILSKPYIKPFLRRIISSLINYYEKWVAKKMDYVITATPFIAGIFKKVNSSAVEINNFPLLDELILPGSLSFQKRQIFYVGGITQIRGLEYVIDAMANFEDVKLVLAGDFENEAFKEKLSANKGWKNVEICGFVNRSKVAELMKNSFAGIVTFLPEPNHVNAQPNKFFEYMSAQLPVIASDFPLWKEIIEGNNCGICVNPENAFEIANAIKYLSENESVAKQMGENGRRAVEEKYNWAIEEN